jgi:predicted nucleic acid-binding protein
LANKAFLLDTNAAIARINGDSSIAVTLEAADELFTSVIVLGELYFGAEKSG